MRGPVPVGGRGSAQEGARGPSPLGRSHVAPSALPPPLPLTREGQGAREPAWGLPWVLGPGPGDRGGGAPPGARGLHPPGRRRADGGVLPRLPPTRAPSTYPPMPRALLLPATTRPRLLHCQHADSLALATANSHNHLSKGKARFPFLFVSFFLFSLAAIFIFYYHSQIQLVWLILFLLLLISLRGLLPGVFMGGS